MHRASSLVLTAALIALVFTFCGCKPKPSPAGQVAATPPVQNTPPVQPPVSPDGSDKAPVTAGGWSGDVKDFSYKSFDGKAHKLSEFAGQPIVVNFWAAWCPPCKMELPEFQKVYHANKGKFVFLGIAVDDRENPVQYVKDNGLDWDFGMDVSGSDAYMITSIPLTLFIDAQGNIKERFEGMRSGEDFNKALQSILSPTSSV